jgi:DNA-binding LacI/PurR family transcriptional regulator
MSQTDRAPTIRDVARHARVGVATVSRVLNDSPRVSEEARQRVRRVIAQLGYRRSSTARNLARGRTQTIGVVAPFFTTPSVLERLRGMVEGLNRHVEYDLMLFDVETVQQRADAFRRFARRDRVDGLLIVSLCPSETEATGLVSEGIPVVLVDAAHPDFPHMVIDDALGGKMATEHLLTRGHRRIAFIGDTTSPLGFTSSEQRRLGMRRALREAGVDPRPGLELRAPHGREPARELGIALLSRPDPPTAIFAASDVQAMGALEAASAMDARVPEDIAVIGFDDIEAAAAVGLTTIRQPLRESGLRAVDLLLQALDGYEERLSLKLEPLRVLPRRTT